MKPEELDAKLAQLEALERVCKLCGATEATMEFTVLVRQSKGEWFRLAGSVVWSICAKCADKSVGIAVLTNFDERESRGNAESHFNCALVGSRQFK